MSWLSWWEDYLIITDLNLNHSTMLTYCLKPFISSKYAWHNISMQSNKPVWLSAIPELSSFVVPSLLMKSFMECQVLLLQKKLPFPGYVEFTQWSVLRTHFCRRIPMKSWRPIRAKTLRQKTVRIITSASFLTDWIRAPTMVFRPGQAQSNKKYVNCI